VGEVRRARFGRAIKIAGLAAVVAVSASGCSVDEVLRFARRAGYTRITLWTNDVLADARRIYQRAGFTLDNEARHHSFGKDLTGQNWSRDL